METEFQKHESQTPSAGCCPRLQARGWTFQLAALALTLVSLSATGFLMLHWRRLPETKDPAAANAGALPAKPTALFQNWPEKGAAKPDMVLLLSAEQYGYLQPCGCSFPQYGGLDRRYNFLLGLTKERGWPVVAVDLGDISQKSGPQSKLKYTTSMKALKQLGYLAVGVGRNEMPLLETLSHYSLNESAPKVLGHNIQDKDDKFAKMVHNWNVSKGKDGELKVGVIGVVGPTIGKEIEGSSTRRSLDPDVKLDPVEPTLRTALKDIQTEKPDVLVLLYQGTIDEAKACAAKFQQFHVILCLSREDEPPEKPIKVDNTLIVNVGHKGRYVGVVGVFKTGKADQPFDLRYQLVRLGPEYETPAGKEQGHPILDLFEEYTREVKKGNYLSHYSRSRHPIQLNKEFENATYVGSERCKKCHEQSYKVWKDSPHSHAYQTLVKATKPGLRQFDGECVSCHVTGFGFTGGFKSEAETAHLLDNGCENCHGPASLHVKNPNNPKLNALMNPFRTMPNETPQQKEKRLNALDLSCQKCHDIDNDVHWNLDKWTKKNIFHQEPDLRAAPPPPANK